MSKLYLRSTTLNVGSHARTELSTTMPLGDFDDGGFAAADLLSTPGNSMVTANNAALAQTAEQSGYWTKWLSAVLTVSTIDAATWTFAFQSGEGAAQANAFLRLSLYVLKSDDTVRGYIYDASADLGHEADGTGQVVTFSGSAVSGIVSTDQLALELWVHATQAMATAYNRFYYYDGATDVTDGAAFSSDAATYISTPQDLFPAPQPTYTGLRAGAGIRRVR